MKAKTNLTLEILKKEAEIFCERESKENHQSLLGVTDGKAVGTYVERKFRDYLQTRYSFAAGNSALGIDFPDERLQVDIKVTSYTQPQSSCPFRNARQKIFGLGYHLLVFVYKKNDEKDRCSLLFTHCAFVNRSRTADFTMAKRLREMVADGANKEDIISFLQDRRVPCDEIETERLAEEILKNPPQQGYLTISNALQWRLQYSRVIDLHHHIDGVTNYEW